MSVAPDTPNDQKATLKS